MPQPLDIVLPRGLAAIPDVLHHGCDDRRFEALQLFLTYFIMAAMTRDSILGGECVAHLHAVDVIRGIAANSVHDAPCSDSGIFGSSSSKICSLFGQSL